MHIVKYVLPLITFVLMLLWFAARHLAPNPRTELGESKRLERITHSAWGTALFALGVAVVASLFLFLLTLMLKFEPPKVLAYIVLGIAGPLFAVTFVLSFVRIFWTRPGKIVAALYGVAAIGAWIFWPNWLTVDLLALMLLMAGLSGALQMTLNFKLAAAMVGGLFLYDIVNVYFTGNMLKVAGAALEPSRPLPMLMIVPKTLDWHAQWAAALGAGDVIMPGILILIAGVLAYRHHRPSILYGALAGYLIGFALVEVILLIAHHGQPALLTLYPCVMAGILLATWRAGLLRELFALRHESVAKAHNHDEDDDTPVPV